MADRTLAQIIAALETDVYGEEMRTDIVDLANKLDDIVEDAVDHQLITVDATLTQSGQGADAAVVGTSLEEKADKTTMNNYLAAKCDKYNPATAGSFSNNRLEPSTVGSYSATLNRYNTASGVQSLAIGDHTIAASAEQMAEGRYNVSDSNGDYAHIVGNGTADDARSNAATLDWSGNAWFAGTVKVGSGNKELATKDYVDSSTSGTSGAFTANSCNASAVFVRQMGKIVFIQMFLSTNNTYTFNSSNLGTVSGVSTPSVRTALTAESWDGNAYNYAPLRITSTGKIMSDSDISSCSEIRINGFYFAD